MNTLWTQLCQEKPVIKDHLRNVIESDYVPRYHPFRYYLEHLPPWTPDQGDFLMELSLTVTVKGDADEQIRFYEYLKKWMVAMVASWVDPQVVNNVMLVSWAGGTRRRGLPTAAAPAARLLLYEDQQRHGVEGRPDNAVEVRPDVLGGAGHHAAQGAEQAEGGDDHAQHQRARGLRALPREPSAPGIVLRHGQQPAVPQSDPTGTRRWLPFEVESIDSPREHPFDYEGIYAQAYALYRQGYRYWFDRPEIERLQRHNEQFEAPNMECELIDQYFRKPKEGEVCEELPATVVMQTVGANMTARLSAVMVGRALVELGYRYRVGAWLPTLPGGTPSGGRRDARHATPRRPGMVGGGVMVGGILKTLRVPRTAPTRYARTLDFYPTIPTITTPIKFYSVTMNTEDDNDSEIKR